MDWATGASSGSTTALRPAPPFSPGTVRSCGRIGDCWTCCPPGRARQMPGDSSLRAVFAHAQGACTFAKSVGFGSQTNVRSDASARVTLALARDGFQARPRERQGVFSFRSGARLWRAPEFDERETWSLRARRDAPLEKQTDRRSGWLGGGAGGTLCAPPWRAEGQVCTGTFTAPWGRLRACPPAAAPPLRPPLLGGSFPAAPRRRRGARSEIEARGSSTERQIPTFARPPDLFCSNALCVQALTERA